jgi:hypothetical protein
MMVERIWHTTEGRVRDDNVCAPSNHCSDYYKESRRKTELSVSE